MSVLYPSLESAEFEQGFQSATRAVEELAALFDQHQVFQPSLGQLSLLRTRLDAWLASFDLEQLLQRSAVARDHAFMLRKAHERAAHQMSSAEERLASKMSQIGSKAWTALWNRLTSQLTVKVEREGQVQAMTMSDARKLAYSPDRELRRRAYGAEMAAWEETAVTLVAALNSIKGEQVLLAKERGWNSPLEAALANNNIDQQTFDALMEAVQEAYPDFQRYLRAKARLLGVPQLAWYDLNAPVEENGEKWSYAKAEQFIIDQFGRYSPKMADLARRAFGEGWIDAQPRAGKIDVSYSARFQNGESRILVNFKPTFLEVTLMAHELGHAYHNLNLAQRTAWQRETPLTLAETASAFCQTLVQTGGPQQADTQEQIAILEASLQLTTMMVVEATNWFFFEKAVCEKRERGELSLDVLKQLMLDVQRQSYGDSLDSEALHPFSWTAWPHQYWSSFYNFQYTFGTLFALGLYRRYQDDPGKFKARYDDLLAATGMSDAAELAGRFGIDIRSADFWRASLDVVRADIDRFETAVAQWKKRN
jgi:pepF/M3 family oligoendopeptidase